MYWYEETAMLLMDRIRRAGMGIHAQKELIVPPLPDDAAFVLKNNHSHRCEDEPLTRLPFRLIVDVQVEEVMPFPTSERSYVQAKKRFAPYWLVDVRIGCYRVPDRKPSDRFINPIEAACLFAQDDRYGSVQGRVHENEWRQEGMQAYYCPDRRKTVLSRFGMPNPHRHIAICGFSIRPDGFEFETWKPGPPVSPAPNEWVALEPDQPTTAEASPPEAPTDEKTE